MTVTPQLSPHQRVEGYLSLGTHGCWRWYVLQGAGLMLLGVVSLLISAAPDSGLLWAAGVQLAAGAVTLVATWRAERCPGVALSLALAFVAIATGAYLSWTSPEAPEILSLTFAAFFASRGILTILLAVAHRRRSLKEWEWLTVSGVTGLILALLILSGLPGPFTWMLGVLLGVSLIFDGSAFLALALASDVKSEVKPAAAFDTDRPIAIPSAISIPNAISVAGEHMRGDSIHAR